MFIKKIKTCKRQVSKQKKRKQTRKVNRKISHNGGNQQLTAQTGIAQIISKVNANPGNIIGEINTALQNYIQQKPSTDSAVTALQQKYSTGLSGNKLYDLIYVGQKLTQYDSTKSPSLIWNHGVNHPKSITAGKLGTHIYIYEDANTGSLKLLGVVIKKDKWSVIGHELLTLF